MNKYFKLYETYNNNEELKEWAYEYAKSNHDGLNSYEDAVEELDIFFEYEFPSFQDTFKLYRVLQVENEQDINEDELGEHYLDPSYLERIYEKEWYDSINLELNDYDKLFLVEVEANYNIVDWVDTINNRLNFPREFEITLKETPKILSIVEIDQEKIN